MANDIKVSITLEGQNALNTIKALEKGITSFGKAGVKKTDEVAKGIKKTDLAIGSLVGNLGAIAVFKGLDILTDSVRGSFQAFAEFEAGLINVQKTTNLTDKEIQELAKDITKLSKVIPVSTRELLEIGTAAGQLGVKGRKNILNFTETIAKLGKVSDVSGEDAAKSLTRILNVTGESVGNVDELASAIVDLGNNFAASESEILRATNEVARATGQFNVASAEAAGLATALQALGINAEAGGTVIGKAFLQIQKSIENGGKPLEKLQEILGQTGDVIRKNFREDAAGTFVEFVKGVNRLATSSKSASTILAEFGLSGDRVNKVIPVLAKNSEILSSALDRSKIAFQENTATNEEFAKAAESTESQVQLLSNAVDILQRRIGKNLAEATKSVTPGLATFIAALGEDQETTFIKATDDVKTLQKELDILTNKLKAVEENTILPDFLLADPEEIKQNITDIQNKLEGINTQKASDNLATLNAELKELEAQRTTDPLLQSILGDPAELEAKILSAQEKIANFKKQLVLEEGVEVDTGKIVDDAVETEELKFSALRELKLANKELELEEKEEEKLAKELEDEEEFQRLAEVLGREATARELHRISQIDGEAKRIAAIKKLNDKADAVALQQAKVQNAADIKLTRQTTNAKLNIVASSLALAEALTGKSNKAIFFAQKALSVAQIIIAGQTAEAAALAPPPLGAGPIAGVGLAGLIRANTVIQVATVAATSAGSFQAGGIVQGASQTGDQLTADVNGGEAIFNRRQQQNLFNAVDSGAIGGAGGDTNISITSLTGDIPQESIDNIIDQLNDRTEFGNRSLGVA